MIVLPAANYLVRNAQLRTQPITVHHEVHLFKAALSVGHEDEAWVFIKEDLRQWLL